MKTLEEKKKIWETKKAKKIAERMAKAETWRAEAEARRLEKQLPVLPRVEKPKEAEAKPVEKILGEVVKPKKVKRREKSSKPKKEVVKPMLKKIFPKKEETKKLKPKKKIVAEKPASILKKEIEKVREEIRKPIKALREELKKKIEEVSATKAELKRKKIKKRGRPKKEVVEPVKRAEELVAAILKEPLPEEKPKVEKVEEEKMLVETAILTGFHTEISMPKTKEGVKLNWSTKRFMELEEKLKKLRRF